MLSGASCSSRPGPSSPGTRSSPLGSSVTSGPLLMHRRRRARRVQEVLDVLDALDLARLADELVDQLAPLDLAAELHDALLRVDRDVALGRVGGAEDLGLDLARERDVVDLRRGLAVLAVLAAALHERELLDDGRGARRDGLARAGHLALAA